MSFSKTIAPRMPADILPKVFKRYVADIFVMFLCQSHSQNFVICMDTKHPNIKFTSEFKENYSFSFLDVKITLSSNQLVTAFFGTATFSGVLPTLKVLCLAHTSLAYFTPYFIVPFPFVIHMKFDEETVLLKKIFKENEYPQFFIDKCIKKYFPKRIIHTVDKKQVLLILSFLDLLSF